MKSNGALPLLEFPEAVFLKVVTHLPLAADLVALRAACKTTRSLLNANAIRWLVDQQPDTGNLANIKFDYRGITVEHPISNSSPEGSYIAGQLLRLYANLTNPIIDASRMGGAWTDEPRYFRREIIEGTASEVALLLWQVWWLDVCCEAKAVEPGIYIAKVRMGIRTDTERMQLQTSMTPKLDSEARQINKQIILRGSALLNWSPGRRATTSQWVFQELNVGQLDLKSTQDVAFKITELNTKRLKSGIVFDTIRLVRQANQAMPGDSRRCRVQ